MSIRRIAPALLLAGCATTYEEAVADATEAFAEGEPARAAELLEEAVGDAEPQDRTLLELERAMALQAAGEHERAAWTLVAADEVLGDPHELVGPVSDTLLSTRESAWRPQPHEELLVHLQATLSFLGAGLFEEAAVEARRARLCLLRPGADEDSAWAWGLCGLAFELHGNENEADDAFRAAGETGLERRAGPGEGTILVVVQDGRVPVRREASFRLLVGGHLRRLELPVPVPRDKDDAGLPAVALDGSLTVTPPLLLDVGARVFERYDELFPRLLAAGVLQLLPRALLSDQVRDEIHDDELSEIVATLFEEWLAEAGPADLRSWTLLPDEVRALRLNVAPGRHRISLALPGAREPYLDWDVDVGARGFALVNVVAAVEEGVVHPAQPRGGDLSNTPAGIAALELLEGALVAIEVAD